ncbi:MAG: hypothetical protein AABY85_12100 [Gemmatimonadota bacterium]
MTTCTATGPGASSCPGVSLTFSAYAPGDHFGADFQSDAGSGASSPITITFSQSVSSVTVTAQDPTFAGNQMQAFSAGGALLGTAPIAGNGTPGTNVPQTVTVSAIGIRSITLTPAAADYVAYSGLSFATLDTCTVFQNPVTDPLLNNPEVQDIFRNLAEQTHWNLPFGQQTEAGGFIATNNNTGAIRFFPYNQPQAIPPGPCLSGYTQQLTLADIPNQGFTIVGQVHTHPSVVGGSVANPGNCYSWNGQSVVPYPANPLLITPGPSPTDFAPWQAGHANPGYPGYVIGPGRIDRWVQVNGQLVPPTTMNTNACVATGG